MSMMNRKYLLCPFIQIVHSTCIVGVLVVSTSINLICYPKCLPACPSLIQEQMLLVSSIVSS